MKFLVKWLGEVYLREENEILEKQKKKVFAKFDETGRMVFLNPVTPNAQQAAIPTDDPRNFKGLRRDAKHDNNHANQREAKL